jgi:hypothetical protein
LLCCAFKARDQVSQPHRFTSATQPPGVGQHTAMQKRKIPVPAKKLIQCFSNFLSSRHTVAPCGILWHTGKVGGSTALEALLLPRSIRRIVVREMSRRLTGVFVCDSTPY